MVIARKIKLDLYPIASYIELDPSATGIGITVNGSWGLARPIETQGP